MDLYVIRRPSAWANLQELEAAGAKSAKIGNDEMSDRVRWIRSYVVKEPDGRIGTVCIYQAKDPESIREHARRVGMPGDQIFPVRHHRHRPRRPCGCKRRRLTSIGQRRTSTMNVQTPMPATPDLATIKNRQQAAWGSGDYAIIGTTLQIVGETLCEAVDLRSNQRVLDVAAGNGNATLAAARRFAEVVSTDYVGRAARARTRARRGRASAGHLPGSRRRRASLRRCELRRRAFDLRRDVHAESAAGGKRTRARLPPRRQDRPGQLDAGQLHRPGVQDHRQIRSAGARHEIADAVGRQGASRYAVSGAGTIAAEQREFVFRYKSPEHWIEVFRNITDRW